MWLITVAETAAKYYIRNGTKFRDYTHTIVHVHARKALPRGRSHLTKGM